MEADDEVKGEGNSYTAEFWQYDSRLGRRWNTDPVVKYFESSYACFGGNPIMNVDPKGDDWYENKNYDKSKDVADNPSTHQFQWFEGDKEIEGFAHLGAYLIQKNGNNISVNYQKTWEKKGITNNGNLKILVQDQSLNEEVGGKKQAERAEEQGIFVLTVGGINDLKAFTSEINRNGLKYGNMFISSHKGIDAGELNLWVGNDQLFSSGFSSDFAFLKNTFSDNAYIVLYQCTVVHGKNLKEHKNAITGLSNTINASIVAPMYVLPMYYLFTNAGTTLDKKVAEGQIEELGKYAKSQYKTAIKNNGTWILGSPNQKARKIKNLNTSGGNVSY
jgi:hypothetical protein